MQVDIVIDAEISGKESSLAVNNPPSPDSKPSELSQFNNDQRAYIEQLFVEHRVALQRYLSGLLSSKDLAQELLQDVYLRILNQKTYEHIKSDNARAYLFKIALNMVIDHGRKQKSRQQQAHYSLEENDLIADSCNPDQIHLWGQGLQRLKYCLYELPTRNRQIFLMRQYKNLTTTEIADILKISKKTVERDLKNVMEHLKDNLKELLQP